MTVDEAKRKVGYVAGGKLTPQQAISTYHDEPLSLETVPAGKLREQMRELIRLGRAGTLQNEEFARLGKDLYAYRQVYATQVSWAVFTWNFGQEVHTWLTKHQCKTVLEVAAGKGAMRKVMKRIDSPVHWTCTDSLPPRRTLGGKVEECDAMQAIERFPADVLFAAWIPHGSTLDQELVARWVVGKRKPMILVGEAAGGCTGSENFTDVISSLPVKTLREFSLAKWSWIYDFAQIIYPC